MRTQNKPVLRMLGVLLTAVVLSGIVALPARAGKIIIQDCLVVVSKVTDVSSGTLFDFAVDFSSGGDLDFSLPGGESFEFGLDFGESVVVSEIVPEGWALADVSCETGGGIIAFADGGNGFTASCLELGEAQCVFSNVLLQRPIPTLSEWGMISAVVGLALIGVYFALRRRKAQAV